MSIRKRIIDYSRNEEEIEKWLRVKGEEKYSQFANMLHDIEIPLTWENISDLYRYDKRLLFNSFKYLSFFEEYARAIIVRNSENPMECYDYIHSNGTFGQLDKQLLAIDKNMLEQYFDSVALIDGLQSVNVLRRAVAHNKIIINEDCKDIFPIFCSLLPSDYRQGFKKDINSCDNKLCVPDKFQIKL